MLALDVSGSMGSPVHGMPYLSCREASAAMALVTAAIEPYASLRRVHERRVSVAVVAHDIGLGSGLTPLAISPRQRLDDVVQQISNLPFGGTDCALPMVEALKHRWAVDTFVVYTDSETWAGNIHPAQALRAVSRAHGDRGEAGGRRDGLERVHDRGPGRRRHAGRGRVRHGHAAGHQDFAS